MALASSGRALPALAWAVERLPVLLRPRRVPEEREGICNPGGVRGPDGDFYLFPRCVGPGNYSRIALARVRRDREGAPVAAERLGWAIAPDRDCDCLGCEDARVTYVPRWRTYVMVYVALGAGGPRLALAYSRDLRLWCKAGLVGFEGRRDGGPELADVANKDGLLFGAPVCAPDGAPSWALVHRPMAGPGGLCLWLSYARLRDLARLGRLRFGQHAVLACGAQPWESDRIGGGSAPLLTAAGWLLLYHGVAYGPGRAAPDAQGAVVPGKVYAAGALLLDRRDPRCIVARSSLPLFGPKELYERCGAMPNVVFPTAVEPDPRDAAAYYVYYGAADYCCAVVRLAPAVGAAPSQTRPLRSAQWSPS